MFFCNWIIHSRKLQGTFPLHFINCNPSHSIIHFIHIPLYHISSSIFTYSIQHFNYIPNHSIPWFMFSTGTFFNQTDILQLIRLSTANQTFCSQTEILQLQILKALTSNYLICNKMILHIHEQVKIKKVMKTKNKIKNKKN